MISRRVPLDAQFSVRTPDAHQLHVQTVATDGRTTTLAGRLVRADGSLGPRSSVHGVNVVDRLPMAQARAVRKLLSETAAPPK